MYRLKHTIILLILVFVINGSCRNIFRKDLSLTPQQYTQLGMPTYNAIWSEKDFQKAQNAINSVIIKNFYSLPKKGSIRSGNLFRRIVSKDNLSFLEDTTISLQEKAYRIQSLGNMMGQMGTLYTDKIKIRQYYSQELVEIYVAHLYIRGKMLELADKINKSARQEEIMMQSGRKGIVSSYIMLISFLVSEQEKTEAFPAPDLRRLNREILNSLSLNMQYLDADSKQRIYDAIKNSLEKSKSGFRSKSLKNSLRLLDE